MTTRCPPAERTAVDHGWRPAAPPLEVGFTTFCVKPSQFIDDVDELPGFCRDVVRRAEAMAG